MMRLVGLLDAATTDCALALFVLAPGERYAPEGEASGQGYAAGGQPLTGRRLMRSEGRVSVTWDTPTIWPLSTITARYAVLYDRHTGYVLRMDELPEGERETRNGSFIVMLPERVLTLREVK